MPRTVPWQPVLHSLHMLVLALATTLGIASPVSALLSQSAR
jgi:hypothetical protein